MASCLNSWWSISIFHTRCNDFWRQSKPSTPFRFSCRNFLPVGTKLLACAKYSIITTENDNGTDWRKPDMASFALKLESGYTQSSKCSIVSHPLSATQIKGGSKSWRKSTSIMMELNRNGRQRCLRLRNFTWIFIFFVSSILFISCCNRSQYSPRCSSNRTRQRFVVEARESSRIPGSCA